MYVNPFNELTLKSASVIGEIFVFNLSSDAKAVISPPTVRLVPSNVRLDEVDPLLSLFLNTT